MLKLTCLILLVAAASAAVADSRAPAPRRFTRDENQSIGDYIKALLNNFKEQMPQGIPELSIPPLDPLNVDEFTADIQEGMADLRLHMKNLNVNGLASFVVREATGDLNTMTFTLDIFVPEIFGSGQYDLDGKILIFPLFGKGNAALKVNDMHIQGSARISLDGLKLQFLDFNTHLVFSQVQMYLENIVGGGNLGNLVNTMLNMLGKQIYDQFRTEILDGVNGIIKRLLNEKLSEVDINEIIGGVSPPVTAFSVSPVQDSVNTYIDLLMENLRPFLKANNLDPMNLPEVSTGFSKRVMGIRWRGGAMISSGKLNSLSSIHRIGDFQLLQQGNSITIDGTVGLNKLWGEIRSSAWFMSLRVSPGVSFSTDRVRVRARVTVSFEDDSELIQLEHFGISELSRITVKVTNLGPLGWILSPIANLAVNLVRGRIISSIEDPIRQQIVELLGGVELPQQLRLH